MTLRIRSVGNQAQQNRYRVSIEQVLASIRRTRTGRIVLAHINQSRRVVTIVPWTDNDRNTEAIPENESSSGSQSSTRTAAGTNSRVRFSVERSVLRPGSVQGTADEVHLHELAHAVRQINGAERFQGANLMRISGGFGNTEEFFAATVASVHSSELRRGALANNSQGRVRDPLFFRQRPYSTRLRECRQRMPTFFREMEAIPRSVASYNPFRDFDE